MLEKSRIGSLFRATIFNLAAILALLASSSCSSRLAETLAASPTRPVPTLSREAPTSTSTISPAPATQTPQAEEPGLSIQRSHYTLSASLNYAKHLLHVNQVIRYVNANEVELFELLLMVPPADYPNVFELETISLGEDLKVEPAWEDSQIRIPLSQPLEPGAVQIISIAYRLHIPSPTPSVETRPSPFGYTSRQTNLVDWYPFIPPFSEETGWLAHPPGFFGEYLVYELVDFSVTLHIEDWRDDLTIAASAVATPSEAGNDFHYEHNAARSFAWSISPEYLQITTKVGAITIQSYAFGFHKNANESVLQTTAQALSLYQELFGPYPHQQLSIVEADFLDGMEYDGLFFLSNGFYNLYQGTPGEYLVAIAAHETAHQWFYGLVGNDQAMQPWLDEALCTYAERLYYERYAPEALDWWWLYRIEYYEPQGRVDGSIYNPDGYRAYRDAIYLNGALFLEELRTRVGDAAFFAFLQAYVTQFAGKIATTARFFELLTSFTDENIQDLITAYFPSYLFNLGVIREVYS